MSQQRKLFQQAREIADLNERRAFLLRECGGDPALVHQIEQLILAADQMGDFLESPVLDSGLMGLEISPETWATQKTSDMKPIEDGTNDEDSAKETGVHDTKPLSGDAIKQLMPFLSPATNPKAIGLLGHYEIESVLGEGAFGIVLFARDMKLERPVAIKVLHPTLAVTSPPRKRFLREARSAAAIRHENIVRVYSVEEEPIPYLVMEYVPHGTLQDLIDQDGPLEIADVVLLGGQLLEGLAAAHEAGIIHRDIKPSNLLVENGSRPILKITDFGLARTVDDAKLTQTGFVAGTPLYMSPEQALGRSIDAKSDLFSVGSVLYTALTGRPPFRAPNSLAVLKRVIEDTPRPISEIIPEVPQWICDFLARLHQKSPLDRFESTRQAAKAWVNGPTQVNPTVLPSSSIQTDATDRKSSASDPTASMADTKPARRISNVGHYFMGTVTLIIALVALGLVLQSQFNQGSQTQATADPLDGDREAEKKASDKDLESLGKATGSPPAPPPPNEPIANAAAASSEVSTDQDAKATPPARPVIRGPWGNDAPPFVVSPCPPEVAAAIAQQWADYLIVPLQWKHPSGVTFRLIPPGEFTRGTLPERIEELVPNAELIGGNAVLYLRSETPVHRVVITQPFYLSIHEVTQRQYMDLMGSNPSFFQKSDESAHLTNMPADTGDFPAERMSWLDACRFCDALNRRADILPTYNLENSPPIVRQEAIGYRLPTEAEWEYACLAGSEGPFSTGNDQAALIGVANVAGRIGHPLAVGMLGSNAWGLYDMHGNLNEWVQDLWNERYSASEGEIAIDPKGAAFGDYRVTRGGDFFFSAPDARAGCRFAANPIYPAPYATGFRVAASVMVRRGAPNYLFDSPAILKGATLDQFASWAKELGNKYILHGMNARFGSSPNLIDAIAIPNLESKPWEFHIVEDTESDFLSMNGTHRAFSRLLIDRGEDLPTATIMGWVVDTGFWQTHPRNTHEEIAEVLSYRGIEGLSPLTVMGLKTKTVEKWASTKVPLPGAETRYFTNVDPAELVKLMDEYRQKNWKPIRLNQHLVGDSPRFFVLFRDNPHQIPWDFSNRIAEAEFDKLVESKKSEGLVPAQFCSEADENGVWYRVIWMGNK
jgi:serine/threonine protein kinase/formylglycine-generating enzyme required for sulfatase activity